MDLTAQKKWMEENVVAFEDYLKDAHYDLFPSVLDDDLADHFNNWVSNLTRRELQDHANNMCLDWAKWTTDEYIKQNFAPFVK